MSEPIEYRFNKQHSNFIDLITRFVGYFDGCLKQFHKNSAGKVTLKKASETFVPKLLIVAHSHYHERNENFPITEKKDLYKILKLQQNEDEISIIQHIEEHQSSVNIWTFSETVPSALFTFPESLLLLKGSENGEVVCLEINENEISYMTKFQDVIYSGVKSTIIDTPLKFSMSAGISLTNEVYLSSDNKAEALIHQLFTIKPSNILPFVSKPKPSTIKRIVLKLIMPTTFVAFAYFTLTSAYLSYRVSSAEAELSQQNKHVKELFSLQNTFERNEGVQQELYKFWEGKIKTAGLWVALAPVFETSRIKTISYKSGKFYIKGRTPNALSILEVIAQNNNVESTKFESPVRKDRNQEAFNISIKLKKNIDIPNTLDIPVAELKDKQNERN